MRVDISQGSCDRPTPPPPDEIEADKMARPTPVGFTHGGSRCDSELNRKRGVSSPPPTTRIPHDMKPRSFFVATQVSLGRMQKFFELEELHSVDREWTNKCGNYKGAGALSVSGRFIWTPDAQDEEAAEANASGEVGEGKKAKAAAVSSSEKEGVLRVRGGVGTLLTVFACLTLVAGWTIDHAFCVGRSVTFPQERLIGSSID